MREQKINIRKILNYFSLAIKKSPWLFAWGYVVWGVSKVLAGIITPIYYQRLVDIITTVSDRVAVWPSILSIFLTIVVIIGLYNLTYRIGEYLTVRFQVNGIKQLSNVAFSKLQNHSYKFFANNFAGSLVAKHRRFVRSFEVLHDETVFSFWMISIQIVGTLIVLYMNNSFIGWLFLFWSLAYILITYLLARRKMRYDLKVALADSEVTGRISDVLANILNIKVFSSSLRESKGFEQVTEQQRLAQYKNWLFNNLIFAIQGVLMAILEVGGMYIALRLWVEGVISAGTVVLVQIYISIIFGSLWQLGRSITRFFTALADADEMVEILGIELDVQDAKEPVDFKVDKGEIVFDKVSFSYDGDNELLEGFNLVIKPGQKIGLVGESGAGKTTITKILLRFADLTGGKILIDGQDISKVTQDDLRNHISYVPQEPLLFHRTLEENISYGKPGASKEEIVAVSKRARAHDFISTFPSGYQTLVGERGVKLSGGERQRVAIARAMLENAPMVVLDEATSSLDSISEKAIQEAFEELLKSKTAIVIAHRLSTIRKMDRIIVMDKGEIVEDGSHKDLLDKKGYYFELWQHQQDGFIE
jgi:ATP-binding cassette subfamily B protein